MQKNSITNKITPCCGLPFSVIYWWVSNLTLNSEADREFIISKISQGGIISIDAWKILINSGTLEADTSLTKAEFLAWFDCGRQPNCEQLKLIIEGFKIGNWTPETELPFNMALIDGQYNGVNFEGNVFTKEQTLSLLNSSFGGKLMISDNPQPTEPMWFFAGENGVFANAGNLNVNSENITILSFDGASWEKVEIQSKLYTDADVLRVLDISGSGNLFDKNTVTAGAYLDLSGVHQPNVWFNYSDFIKIKPNTDYWQNIPQIRNFYDKNKNHISGYAGETNWTSPSNAEYVKLVVSNDYLQNFILSESNVPIISAEHGKPTIQDVLTPKWKIIHHNNTAYNSIRTLADSLIAKSNYFNRYEIQLWEGTYNETDWKGWGKYVKIKGMSRDICIVYFNGNSTNVLPNDYSYSNVAGQAANAAAQPFRHIVFASRDCLIENLTLFAENCKYPVHCDNPQYELLQFKHVRIKEKNCNFPVGSGIWGGQKQSFENCIIQRLTNGAYRNKGVLVHNSTAQEKPSMAIFKNCQFLGCSYGIIYENGSNQDDKVIFENCSTDGLGVIEFGVSQDADGKTFWTNNVSGVKVAEPQNIPYNLKVEAVGTRIDYIEDSPNFTGFNSSRPEFYLYFISDYFGSAQYPADANVKKGDLLTNYGDSQWNDTPRANKYQTTVLSLPPFGVALHDGVVGEPLYFSKIDRISRVKIVDATQISNYNGNTRKLIYNESLSKFEVSATASWKTIDGVAFENIETDGLIAVKVLMK